MAHTADETEALRDRLRELEAENERLRTAPASRRRISGRSILAGLLIVVALVLAPVAALGSWARMQLVDSDRFVSTFAPLAEDPAVQELIVTQVSAAIEQNLDIDALVGTSSTVSAGWNCRPAPTRP